MLIRLTTAGALACALALVGGAGPAASASCTSPASPAACAVSSAPPLLTTRQAGDAIEALWNARERALRNGDVTLLSEIETGTALAADRYEAKGTRCCWKNGWTKAPRRYLRSILHVTRQDHYPLVFAAQVVVWSGPNTDPWKTTAMFVLTRPSPAEPWRIASIVYDMRYDAPIDPFSPPRMDLEGYELPGQDASPAQARGWLDALADYYRGLKRTGEVPAKSRFLPGWMTTRSELEEARNGVIMGGGETVEYGFRHGAGPWVFSSNGGTMACGEVIETVTQRPRLPFHHLRQDEQRTNWGPDIAPGLYASITRLVAWTACIVEAPGGLYVGGTQGVDVAHVVNR